MDHAQAEDKPPALALLAPLHQLPFPPLLEELVNSKRWVHPGEQTIRKIFPHIEDELYFPSTKDDMMWQSLCLFSLCSSGECLQFSEYLGSIHPERELPWIDIELVIFIIVGRYAGSDWDSVSTTERAWQHHVWSFLNGSLSDEDCCAGRLRVGVTTGRSLQVLVNSLR